MTSDLNDILKNVQKSLKSPELNRDIINSINDSLKRSSAQIANVTNPDYLSAISINLDSINKSYTLALEKIASKLSRNQSEVFKHISVTNSSISTLIKNCEDSYLNKRIQQQEFFHSSWQKIQKQLPDPDLFLKSHLADIARLSALSQVSHLSIKGNIGNALNIKTPSLEKAFNQFAQSYSKLFESFSNNPESLFSLPPIASKYPTIEFFQQVRVLECITNYETDESQGDFDDEENSNILEEMLKELDVDLFKMLCGARQSLDSTNVDKVRHFAISLRELFTHLLQILAPDNKIKQWSTSKDDYYDGRPTRKARVSYICHPLNHELFSNMFDDDISNVIKLFKSFNEATHKKSPSFTNMQLNSLLSRAETALLFLLGIWKENQNSYF